MLEVISISNKAEKVCCIWSKLLLDQKHSPTNIKLRIYTFNAQKQYSQNIKFFPVILRAGKIVIFLLQKCTYTKYMQL